MGTNEITETERQHGTRDALVIATQLKTILDSEIERYNKAKKSENIEEGFINNRLTDLARNIISSGKKIAEILEPPQKAPLLQQNNNFNFPSVNPNQIMRLPEDERLEVLQAIDAQILEEDGKGIS